MAFSWIILLLVSMVHTRATNKLKRAKKFQRKGEFDLISDSETEADNDGVDWDKLTDDDESLPVKPEQKAYDGSKGKASDGSKGKATMDTGKAPMAAPTISVKRKRITRRFGLRRDIDVDTPIAPDSPSRVEEVFVNTDRLRAFAHRECIGERHVNIEALRGHSPEFGVLIEQANLIQVCRFPETLGYCLHHVRTFYTNARHLREFENGPMEFYTNIQGTRFKITPHLIGEVLGMQASKTGINFLKGIGLTNTMWQKVIEGICLEGTQSTEKSVKSKELRLEYRFLNFITCYNILPNMQTKVVRWDRLLFLYLLGHPSEATALNINIPYIIWNRMARYVEHPHPTERIPFPLIIMRILKKFQVDISSTTYHHCLSMIDESTIVKSLHKLPHVTPVPASGTKPSTSTAASPSQPAPAPANEESVSSIYKEQQRLSVKQEQISKEQQRISNELELITAAHITITKKDNSMNKLVKKMFSKMGCTSFEDSDSDD